LQASLETFFGLGLIVGPTIGGLLYQVMRADYFILLFVFCTYANAPHHRVAVSLSYESECRSLGVKVRCATHFCARRYFLFAPNAPDANDWLRARLVMQPA
jgi:hypothetical protein